MHFTFKGESSLDYNITLLNTPEERTSDYRYYEDIVEGVDGGYIRTEGFTSTVFKINMAIEGDESQVIKVLGWLKGRGEFSHSIKPNKFIQVDIQSEVEFTYKHENLYTGRVVFYAHGALWYDKEVKEITQEKTPINLIPSNALEFQSPPWFRYDGAEVTNVPTYSFDELSGGINLLPNSKNEYQIRASASAVYPMEYDVLPDGTRRVRRIFDGFPSLAFASYTTPKVFKLDAGTYTTSFEVKPTGKTIMGKMGASGPLKECKVNEWTQLHLTYNVAQGGEIQIYGLYTTLDDDEYKDQWFEYRNFKLEKGSVATPWTPSPYDYKGGVNLLQSDKFMNVVGDTSSMSFSMWAETIFPSTNLLEILKVGETYTLSYEMELLSLPTGATYFSRNCGINIYSPTDPTLIVSTVEALTDVGQKKRIVRTFTINQLKDQRLLGYSTRNTDPVTTGRVRITNLKLEKGSVATPYDFVGESKYRLINTSGGTSIIKYAYSIGVSQLDVEYTSKVKIRNIGSKRMNVNSNRGVATWVEPNQYVEVIQTAIGNGVGHMQIQFRTENIDDPISVIVSDPEITNDEELEYAWGVKEMYNKGNIYSKPLLKLKRIDVSNNIADVIIMCESDTNSPTNKATRFQYEFMHGDTDVYIDCETQEAYTLTNGIKRDKLQYLTIGADFPILQVGTNYVKSNVDIEYTRGNRYL